ncbi:efflux RND transporter periplasmic adaptor subunit [Microcoleus sp. FACHB-SPT15]|uniref:HlyD family secretion protein n=1 Tax=Microcoleus sp. FACHB-SPT15 TaxID=2692830 RepID=UPI001786C2BC|nr:efflux RND transporter periplasmic adaptor subunit [Microcoleus sp. FACHB-SPT15]MBD1806298.1 efflux RND transporter periplasmic adaptor subunit [Microcoleus sp. FACHB-SPT15]
MTSSNFNSSHPTHRQSLKVVPPSIQKAVPPVTQASSPITAVKSTKSHQKLIILGAIVAGLGYVGFVPQLPHSVRGEANISSTYNARQDVTLNVAGVVKEIYVNPNEKVSKGQKLVVLESEEVENAIAKAKTELGQAQSAIQDSLRMVEDLQAKLTESRVREQTTQQEVSQRSQEAASINQNSLPQVQELESEITGLEKKRIQLQSNSNIIQQQINRINAVNQEAGDVVIPQTRLDEFQREYNIISGEVSEITSQIASNKAQIKRIEKDLQDKLRQVEAEFSAARAARKSVEESLQAANILVIDRRRQVAELQTEVKRQEEKRKQLILTASTTGTVITEDLDRLTNRFQPAGEKLLEIVDLSNLTVIAQIRQEDEKFIQKGDTVKFYKQGEIQPHTTKVEYISSASQQEENQVKPVWIVRLSIKNNGENLMKPGMTGYVSIETQPMTLFEKLKHEVLKVVRPILL